jgi:ankyrin repeat protein
MSSELPALLEACKAGDEAAVKSLLGSGVDPNGLLSNGRFVDSPLRYAVDAGSISCVRLLLDSGADVNAPLDHLCVAAYAKTVEMLRVLVRAGVDKTWHTYNFGLVGYLASADRVSVEGRAAMIRALAEHGYDINFSKATPNLWLAAQFGEAEAVDALLRGGADPQVQPNPLGGAVWGDGGGDKETQEVIELLVAAGCRLDTVDTNGFGLLHGALMPYSHGEGFMSSDGMNTEALHALLRHGISVDITFWNGWRPLHMAAQEGDPEAIKLLLAAGAAIEERTPDGRTALDIATASGASARCISLLGGCD